MFPPTIATRISRIKTFVRAHWIIVSIAAILIIGGLWYFFGGTKDSYQFVTVTKGTIIQTVSVTGNTTPTSSVSLGFQNTGTIAHVYRNLGDRVGAGEVIAELNTANLYAALEQAKASLAAEEANLSSLTAGTRPEQLTIDRNSVTQSEITLVNAITSAYAVSDSVIHASADQLFINPRNASAALSFIISDASLANTLAQERVAIEPMLTEWSSQIASPTFGSSDPHAVTLQAMQNLALVRSFLNDAAAALTKSINLSAANLTSYESSISSARTSVAGALTTLTSAQTSLTSAEGALALSEAGSTSHSVAAQQAQVAQAQAGVTNALANLRNAKIIAPISGVITQQDAKLGQLASTGVQLVSIIGNGGFEVDAGVSEMDVGKLTVGDKVTMTFDAFQNETFSGSVFYIAPAQTNTQGVISYQIKIAFDKSDPRIKSGLTANIDIQTEQKNDVLILPQYAVLQNDDGTFIETLSNDTVTTTPITLGIQDQKGNVEIISGATLGEQVINIGLKSK